MLSLLEELVNRGGLRLALADRDAMSLSPILEFIIERIADPSCSNILLTVASMIIDIYTPFVGQSVVTDQLIVKLHGVLVREIKFQGQVNQVLGMMEMLLANTGSVAYFQ